jgi:hypothetical protein
MNATTNSSRALGKSMKLNTLTEKFFGRCRLRNNNLSIFMNIAIREFHLFSRSQPKPNKGHIVDPSATQCLGRT